MANIVEQAIIELQSVYKGGGAEKAKKDLANLKRELKNANGSVQRLQSSLKQLNRVPIAFDDQRAMGRKGARGAAISEANKALKEYFSTIQTGRRQLAATEAGLKAQSAAFNRIAANAKKGGELYSAAVNSQVRAEQKLRLAQLERLKVEQDLFSKGRTTKNDAFKGVDELLSMGNKLPRTIGALSLYKSELEQTLRVVEIGSDKYKALEKAIEATTQKMQGQQKKKVGLAGLKEDLAAAKKEQEELVVGRAGTKEWVEATVRVKKAQFEYNKELAKSRIGTALINADINGSVRALNLAKQAAKGGLGILGGVAGAVGGAGKKALGTRFGQIGAARGIDALAKKVPVVDKAFGRLLQKIPLLGKFLNENISVNARWTAQILEGITGVTVAWNGLNQIISAAQAFTAFERQAAIAINSVARMFKDMYNIAGGMMMGLISPGQVGKNLWDKALDRPDVMRARRGPSRIESLEKQLPKYKDEFKNTELYEYDRIELKARQILEIEKGITHEQRSRIYIMKRIQGEKGGPVWTQYGSPAGPGSKGAGWGSNAQDRLGDIQLKIGEQVTANTLENSGAVKKLLQEEVKVNIELKKRDQILKTLRQGVENVNLSVQEQRNLFGTSNEESLAAQREMATTQSPIATRRGRGKGPVSNEAWARLQRMRSSRQQRNMRFRENLMLGAGFPMLFGGGIGSVGGGVAGAISQRGGKGFGAQIFLSALGQQIDQFVGKITVLGQAFNKFTPNVDAIVTSMGVGGTAIGQQIQAYVDVASKTDALSEASRQMARIIGAEGVQGLKEWGEATTKWKNDFDRAILGIQATLARFAVWVANRFNLLEGEGGLGGRTRATTKAGTDARMNELQQTWVDIQKTPFDREKGVTVEGQTFENKTDAINHIIKLKQERQKILDLENAGLLVQKTVNEITKNQLQDLTEQRQVLEDTLQGGTTHAEIEKRMRAITKEVLGDNKELTAVQEQQIANQRVKVTEAVKEEESLRAQLELWTQIKDTIAGGLTNAIMGLIDKTKTLAESLAGILKQIAQILIQKAITSLINKIPFGGGGVASGGTSAMVAADNAMYGNTFPAGSFSKGGLVTRPTIGLIGEAGEDEYIIPSSKMQGAMERYSAGARGQGVIPGSGTVASGSGVSSSPTVVNYTGPVLSFDSEAYVPKSAIPEIINSAARRGAQEGQSKVFSQLKNSRSQRSRVGL